MNLVGIKSAGKRTLFLLTCIMLSSKWRRTNERMIWIIQTGSSSSREVLEVYFILVNFGSIFRSSASSQILAPCSEHYQHHGNFLGTPHIDSANIIFPDKYLILIVRFMESMYVPRGGVPRLPLDPHRASQYPLIAAKNWRSRMRSIILEWFKNKLFLPK